MPAEKLAWVVQKSCSTGKLLRRTLQRCSHCSCRSGPVSGKALNKSKNNAGIKSTLDQFSETMVGTAAGFHRG
jgi:hypothetical protein